MRTKDVKMIASNETTIVSRLKGYASNGFERMRFATIHRTNHAIWRITKPLLLTAPLMRSVRRSTADRRPSSARSSSTMARTLRTGATAWDESDFNGSGSVVVTLNAFLSAKPPPAW